MACMSSNDEFPSGNFGDSSQLTNWVLYYVATCHMTPEVSNSIPVLLKDTDKHIKVADGNHVTKETCIFWGNKGNVKNKEITI